MSSVIFVQAASLNRQRRRVENSPRTSSEGLEADTSNGAFGFPCIRERVEHYAMRDCYIIGLIK